MYVTVNVLFTPIRQLTTCCLYDMHTRFSEVPASTYNSIRIMAEYTFPVDVMCGYYQQ